MKNLKLDKILKHKNFKYKLKFSYDIKSTVNEYSDREI